MVGAGRWALPLHAHTASGLLCYSRPAQCTRILDPPTSHCPHPSSVWSLASRRVNIPQATLRGRHPECLGPVVSWLHMWPLTSFPIIISGSNPPVFCKQGSLRAAPVEYGVGGAKWWDQLTPKWDAPDTVVCLNSAQSTLRPQPHGRQGVLVRVLQREATDRMCVHREKEIYYMELAQAIMEAGKSESAVWVSRLKTQESRWCRQSPRAVWWRAHPCSGKQPPLFHSGLQLIRWDPPVLWRAICFTQSSSIGMLISPKNTLQIYT